MKPIEVEFRLDGEGKAIPRSFRYQGDTLRIDSIGRRWEGEDGEHILVMVQPGDRVYELLYGGDTWGLVREHGGKQRPA